MFRQGNQVLPRVESIKRVNSLDRAAPLVPTQKQGTANENIAFKKHNSNTSDSSRLVFNDEKQNEKPTVTLRPTELRESLHFKLAQQKQRQEASKSLWWSSFKARSGAKSRNSSGFTVFGWLRGSARRVGVSLGLTSHHRLIEQKKFMDKAQPGDLLLMNVGQSFEGRMVPLGLIRGVVSTNAKHFLPKTAGIDPWNDIGIIVENSDGVKQLLGLDASGVNVRRLEDVLSLCVYRNITCALRPLHIKKDKDGSKRRHLSDLLSTISTQIETNKGVHWAALSPKKTPVRSSDSKSEWVDQAALVGVLQHVLSRVARVASQPSPDEFAEVMRIFFVLDDKKLGKIQLGKLRKLLLSGGDLSAAVGIVPSDSKSEKKDSTEDNGVDKSSGALAIDVGPTSEEIDNTEADLDLPKTDSRLIVAADRMLGKMDSDADGVITITEFLENYIKVARGGPDQATELFSDPKIDGRGGDTAGIMRAFSAEDNREEARPFHDGNVDIPAVAKGEFVGLLLLYLGILEEHRVEDGAASTDGHESPQRKNKIDHTSTLAVQLDNALPRNVNGYFSPSSFSTQGPPEGHQGVDLSKLMRQFQTENLQHNHWGNSDAEKGVYLKSLICPVHITDEPRGFHGNTNEVYSGNGLIGARRHLNVRMAAQFSFEPELFLSRNV